MQKQLVQQVRTQFWLGIFQPIGFVSIGLMLTGATVVLSASIGQAASLQWQYDPGSAALSVNLPPGTTPRYFLAAQPARIVVDLPNTEVGAVQTEKQFPGAVQQIRISQFQPGVTRIVLQLAPGTVLAPQQVDLQQNGNQWVLRPILADANPTPTQTIAAANSPLPQAPLPQAPDASSAIVAPGTSAEPAPAHSTAATAPNEATNQAASELPPLEPGATEIPVELPPAEAAAPASPTVSVPALSIPGFSAPDSSASAPSAPDSSAAANPDPSVPSSELAASAEGSTPVAQAAEAQTPGTQASESQTSETQAPESQSASPEENPTEAMTAALPQELPPAESNALPTELPLATIVPSSESTVNVPALEPGSPSPARTREVAAIEFGQPLPGTQFANEPAREGFRGTAVAVNSTQGVLLPSGTVLSLRYQGEATLNLSSDYPLQEVLVVDQDVRDQAGQTIVPAGSQVIGRFETGRSGSEFIAQAISIDGQTFPVNGRSDKLSRGRQVPSNRMMQNSAIGAVAGTLLGAFTGVGLIAGIAAGAATSAATTYLTAPQPAVIEPDRVVEVRLLEDLRQPGYGIGG